MAATPGSLKVAHSLARLPAIHTQRQLQGVGTTGKSQHTSQHMEQAVVLCSPSGTPSIKGVTECSSAAIRSPDGQLLQGWPLTK